MSHVGLLAIALCGFLALTAGTPLAEIINTIRDLQEGEGSELELEPVEDVVYDGVGNFSMESPWRSQRRPVSPPQGPDELFARLLFYTQNNTEEAYEADAYLEEDLEDAPFDSRKPTVVIVPGYDMDGHDDRLQRLKNGYLGALDSNAIIVDWGPKAAYTQTVSDIRVIGAMVAGALRQLADERGLNPRTVHLMGHGLGAHLCSYIATDVGSIGRVTGLDPSQMLFEHEDNLVLLDSTDAIYVDVIHTNSRTTIPDIGFGIKTPTGHVDYYVHGGFLQPGCGSESTTPHNVMNRCSHFMSIEYFTESLTKPGRCPFRGSQSTLREIYTNLFSDPDMRPRRGRCIRFQPGPGRSRLRGVWVMYPVETD